jgi:hypothetical protein
MPADIVVGDAAPERRNSRHLGDGAVIMSHLWVVKFRGDEWTVEIDGRVGSEGPTDWHFYGVDNDALSITDEEDADVTMQLREKWLDNAMNAYDEDAR